MEGTDIYGKSCNNYIYDFAELIDFLITYRIDNIWSYGNGSKRLSEIELNIINITTDKVKDANTNNLTETELIGNVADGLNSYRKELIKKADLSALL